MSKRVSLPPVNLPNKFDDKMAEVLREQFAPGQPGAVWLRYLPPGRRWVFGESYVPEQHAHLLRRELCVLRCLMNAAEGNEPEVRRDRHGMPVLCSPRVVRQQRQKSRRQASAKPAARAAA